MPPLLPPTSTPLSPRVVHSVADLHAALAGERPAFVPTMGALHAGHAALISRARELSTAGAKPVVVSIFVNPTQFAPNEDFTRYPRQLEQDVAICARSGATIVFAPDVREMYPAGTDAVADDFIMPALPDVATQPRLEDAFRPTHFAGVCKVVARLFDIVQPAQAIFGEKDYQQLRVISDMVNEQSPRWLDLQIIAHPTIREPDGLAMSSRNVYLSPAARKRALAIWRSIQAAKQERTPSQAEQAMMTILRDEEGFEVDYAVVRNARTLLPVHDYSEPCRALVAARLDNVRLIDSMLIGPVRSP